jgi:hypothetical protein
MPTLSPGEFEMVSLRDKQFNSKPEEFLRIILDLLADFKAELSKREKSDPNYLKILRDQIHIVYGQLREIDPSRIELLNLSPEERKLLEIK